MWTSSKDIGYWSDVSKHARKRSHIAFIESGRTLVLPITGMKLVSPFQRGTTWQCKCDGIPAPAAWPKLKSLNFDEKFKRLWNYYLDYCETGFSLDHTDVTQFFIKKIN